ncbi:hypothetical protein CCMA1212_010518 [Trichoderma ghanense]|uniref:Uncharacterized protein n=1 Tax=Trichoderma ghanense TaxID=65468 RepID=A0ABY2GPE9_9HYPO
MRAKYDQEPEDEANSSLSLRLFNIRRLPSPIEQQLYPIQLTASIFRPARPIFYHLESSRKPASLLSNLIMASLDERLPPEILRLIAESLCNHCCTPSWDRSIPQPDPQRGNAPHFFSTWAW